MVRCIHRPFPLIYLHIPQTFKIRSLHFAKRTRRFETWHRRYRRNTYGFCIPQLRRCQRSSLRRLPRVPPVEDVKYEPGGGLGKPVRGTSRATDLCDHIHNEVTLDGNILRTSYIANGFILLGTHWYEARAQRSYL